MRYEGQIFRPPCEAGSLIIQAQIGCPWNRCTFCAMYKDKKFRIRALEDVLEDLELGSRLYPRLSSLFLADGNCVALPTSYLCALLERARDLFPYLEHVGAYGGARYINQKNPEELRRLRQAGLSIVYLGLESGDTEVLRRVKKGVEPHEVIEAGLRLREAGFPLSVYVLVGLGGRDRWREHASGSAAVINALGPDIVVRPRTLYVQEGTPLWHQRAHGDFVEAGAREALQEVKLLLESLEGPLVLISDHITNYLPLHGRLPEDRQKLLTTLERTLARADLSGLRPEHFAHL